MTAESALARMREKGLADDEIEQMMNARLKKSKKPTMGDDEDEYLADRKKYEREQEIYNGVLDLLREESKTEITPQSTITQTDGSVPDMSVDKASDARKRGFRSVSGVRYDRQKPVEGVEGKEVEIDFTTSEKPVIGKLKVIESDNLQPSHVGRQRNPLHFISEAQPKERTDAVSDAESDKIAQNISPERITASTNAYGGAPVVNERGEVIQGNNRATALRKMKNIPESREKYKQYLMEHAEEFGIKAEDITKMKSPVLVRELKVSDEEAIRLGQFKASDLETGGIERIEPKSTVSKMSQAQIADTMRRMFDVGGEGIEDKTIGQLIDDNGVSVLKYLRQIGVITDTQYQSAFNRKGALTEEAKNDLRKLMLQNIFEGGADNLPTAFEVLPSAAQKALVQAMAGDMRLKEDERLLPEVQKAIMAVAEIKGSGFIEGKKDYDAVKQAIEDLSKQTDAFAGEPITKKYSELELELAARFLTGTQKSIKGYFAQYQRYILGDKGDIFNTSETLTKNEATKKTFNVELKDNNNDTRREVEDTQGDSSKDRLDGRGQSEAAGQPADGGVSKPKTDIKSLSTEELEKRAKFFEVAARTDEELYDNEEYAKIYHQIQTYPKKAERGHVFTDNNYYLCTDIDNEGNFKIEGTLPIEGNEDYINEIRKTDTETFVPVKLTESTIGIVEAIKSKGGRISGEYANAERLRAGTRGNDSVYLGQQTNSRGNRQEVGGDSGTQKHIETMRSAVQSTIDGLGGKGSVITYIAKQTERRYRKKVSIRPSR